MRTSVSARTRTVTWEDPAPGLAQAAGMTGLEYVRAIFETLRDTDQLRVFERFQVARKVTVRELEAVAEIGEVRSPCLVQDRKDAKARALMDNVIQCTRGMGHRSRYKTRPAQMSAAA